MKTNNIEEQLRLIDEFFEENPQKVIDKMFQEAKEANPMDVSFEKYCVCLGEMLSEVMEELSSPIVTALSPIQMDSTAMSLGAIQTNSTVMSLGAIQMESTVKIQKISSVGDKGKYEVPVSYRNDDMETIKAA